MKLNKVSKVIGKNTKNAVKSGFLLGVYWFNKKYCKNDKKSNRKKF